MARLRIYRYQAGDSILHCFETRLKTISYLLLSATLMAVQPPFLAAAAILLAAGYLHSGIKAASFFRQTRPLLFFLLLLALSRLESPGPPLAGTGVTGLWNGLSEAGRILAVLAAGNLFVGVTSFSSLESMLARLPLGRGARRAAMTARLSLALIPLLLETGLAVKESLALRAPRLARRPFKSLLLFAGLFLSRSAVLARGLERGLEARAYSEARAYPPPRRPRPRDWLAFLLALGACAAALVVSGSS